MFRLAKSRPVGNDTGVFRIKTQNYTQERLKDDNASKYSGKSAESPTFAT